MTLNNFMSITPSPPGQAKGAKFEHGSVLGGKTRGARVSSQWKSTATLVGVVCGADDWEGVEEVATGGLDWLRGFLPFANGIPTAQTLRKVFRLLDAQALERGFAAWAASMRAAARAVIAIDGKTLRGSKTSSDGKGALHLVSAYVRKF